MTFLACFGPCQCFWNEDQLFEFEIDAEYCERDRSPTRCDANENGGSPMTLDKNNGSPVSNISQGGATRLPLRRRIKHFGMMAAGQLARVLRRLPLQAAANG